MRWIELYAQDTGPTGCSDIRLTRAIRDIKIFWIKNNKDKLKLNQYFKLTIAVVLHSCQLWFPFDSQFFKEYCSHTPKFFCQMP